MLETIDISLLPSVSLAERHMLPNTPAIYFVIRDKEIFYIGSAKRLCFRWQSHHHIDKFLAVSDIRIAWLSMDSSEALLPFEKTLIAYFKPSHNGRKNITSKRYPGRKLNIRTTTVRLSTEARMLLHALSVHHGLSHTAILEIAIREEARRDKITRHSLQPSSPEEDDAPDDIAATRARASSA